MAVQVHLESFAWQLEFDIAAARQFCYLQVNNLSSKAGLRGNVHTAHSGNADRSPLEVEFLASVHGRITNRASRTRDWNLIFFATQPSLDGHAISRPKLIYTMDGWLVQSQDDLLY